MDEEEYNGTCRHEDCYNLAYYALKGTSQVLYCSAHALTYEYELVTRSSAVCLTKGCFNWSTHGLLGPKVLLTCERCAPVNYVAIPPANGRRRVQKYPPCHFDDGTRVVCESPAPYVSNNAQERYCALHAKNGFNHIRRTCSLEHCMSAAYYWHPRFANANQLGINGSDVAGSSHELPRYCRDHSPPHYAKRGQYCIAPHCKTLATFARFGRGKRVYCKQHGEEVGDYSFVPLVPRLCVERGCEEKPRFGAIDTNVPLYCELHRSSRRRRRRRRPHSSCDDDGVRCDGNTTTFVDVISGRCANEACVKNAIYGRKDTGIAVHCREHARCDDVDVNVKRPCMHEGCHLAASFSKKDEGTKYCAEHSRHRVGFRSNTTKCAKCKYVQVRRIGSLCAGCIRTDGLYYRLLEQLVVALAKAHFGERVLFCDAMSTYPIVSLRLHNDDGDGVVELGFTDERATAPQHVHEDFARLMSAISSPCSPHAHVSIVMWCHNDDDDGGGVPCKPIFKCTDEEITRRAVDMFSRFATLCDELSNDATTHAAETNLLLFDGCSQRQFNATHEWIRGGGALAEGNSQREIIHAGEFVEAYELKKRKTHDEYADKWNAFATAQLEECRRIDKKARAERLRLRRKQRDASRLAQKYYDSTGGGGGGQRKRSREVVVEDQ